MSLVAAPDDFAYGNTRLRARKADLLRSADYEALLGRPVDGVLDALAETAYRDDVEAARARASGAEALEAAVRRRAGRALDEMRSFYAGRARRLVDLSLSRLDLHNLLALLRAQLRGQPAERALAATVPVGALGGAAAEEVARRQEPAAGIELLVLWRLPDADTASALARAWSAFERTQDLAALEHAVAAAHALRVERELDEIGAGRTGPLAELLARERDATNALAVLRLREALETDELAELPAAPAQGRFLAGGKIAPEALEAALRAPARADAAAALSASAARADWARPLERYAAGGDLPRLERELEAARVRFALGLFHRGDPLGVGVPIAYGAATENELRNLRLVAAGAVAGDPAEMVRARLTLPDAGGPWGG